MPAQSTDSYGWDGPAAPQSLGFIGPPVLRALQALGARRVLDLGAGNGALCGQLHALGYDVVGADADATGIEVARSTHAGVPFHHLAVDDEPAALLRHERPFDVVVSTEVIEHLFAPHHLPAFARAVLVPRGWLLLTTPYHGYLKNLALSLTDHWDAHHSPMWHGGHIKFWSRRTLTCLLEDSGFEVTAFTGIGRVPYLWKSMLVVARSTVS